VSATDADGDAITFSSNYNFTFTNTDATHAIAYWTPTNDYVGSHLVTFYAFDGIDSDSKTINITVVSENDAPVLEHVGNLNGYLHVPLLHFLYASDVDNENNYTLTITC